MPKPDNRKIAAKSVSTDNLSETSTAIKNPGATAIEVNKALNQLPTRTVFNLDLDANASQTIAKLKLANPNLSGAIKIFLDSVSGRSKIDWEPESGAWIVKKKVRGIQTPLAKITCVANEDKQACDLNWHWIWPDGVERPDVMEWKTGQLTLSSHDSTESEKHIAFAQPVKSPVIMIENTTFEPAVMQPHFSEYLCDPDRFKLYKWNVTDVAFADSQDDVWLAPAVSDNVDGRTFFNLDKAKIRKELADLLHVDLDQTNAYSEEIDDILDFHGPYGMRIDFLISSSESNELSVKTETMVLIDSPGGDNVTVVFRPNKNARTPREARESLRASIINGILDHVNLAGDVPYKIVGKFGKGAKKLDDPIAQMKAGLGGIIFKYAVEFTKTPLRLEIERNRELRGTNNSEIAIIAISKD